MRQYLVVLFFALGAVCFGANGPFDFGGSPNDTKVDGPCDTQFLGTPTGYGENRSIDFASVLDASTDLIVVVDDMGKILYLNHGAEQLLGQSSYSLVGSQASECFHALRAEHGDLDFVLDRVAKTDVWSGDLELTKNRKVITLKTNARRTILENQNPATILVMSDVSELRALRSTAEKLQGMDSLGRLASGIVHDFNNLLTVILGSSQMALDYMEPNSPFRDLIEEVVKSGGRGKQMTEQLLQMIRGSGKSVKTPLDLDVLLRNFEGFVRKLMPKNVEYSLKLETNGIAARALANTDQLERMLMNLVVNAKDAMPNGGKLSLALSKAYVDPKKPTRDSGAAVGWFLVISVTDTGTGIPKDIQARVFEPFYTTKPKGTGIGLSTVYNVAREHGGFIGLQSEPGKGTQFDVFIPMLPEKQVPAPFSGVNKLNGNGRVAIVMDDEPAVRTVLAIQLRELGYTVVKADNGKLGMDLVEMHKDQNPVVFIDMEMPVMDGRQVLTAMAKDYPGISTVITSGMALPSDMPVRPDAYLPKPYTRTDITAAILSLAAPPKTGPAN